MATKPRAPAGPKTQEEAIAMLGGIFALVQDIRDRVVRIETRQAKSLERQGLDTKVRPFTKSPLRSN